MEVDPVVLIAPFVAIVIIVIVLSRKKIDASERRRRTEEVERDVKLDDE